MTASVSVFQPGFRVTDANDLPVSGATISFYGAGTTTPKTIYSDYNLTVAIGTSVTTDSGGYPTSGGNKVLVYVDTAPFKVTCTDSLGNTVWSHDNVQGAISGSSSSSVTTATATYGFGVGDVKLSVASSPGAGFVRLAETATALTKASYPDLNAWASNLGYPWGSTSTTFNVPPAAGYFLRFAGSSSGVDPDGPRIAGSTQTDAFKSHTHTASVSDPSHTHNLNRGGASTSAQAGSGVTVATSNADVSVGAYTGITVSITSTGGTETRGKNVAMHADMLALPALVANGLIGATGPVWQYNSTTSPASLTAGQFAFNNATPSSGTTIYVSETDYQNRALASGNMAALLQSLPSSTRLYAVKIGSPGVQMIITTSGTATDAGTYDSFTVTVTTNGTFSNGDLFTLVPLLPGPAGTNGVQPGYVYAFDTSTTMAAPATGAIRFNNATYSSATAIALNNNSGDSGNPDISTVIGTWDDSTTTGDRCRLIIRNVSDTSKWVEYKVNGANTGLTGGTQLAVSYIAGSGTFSASDSLVIVPHITGSAGAGNVSASLSFSADNRVLRADGTGTNIQDSAVTIDDTGNVSGVGYEEFEAVSAPSAPASGKVRLYNKTGSKKLYIKDDTGTETDITTAGGGGGGGGNAAYINNLSLVTSVAANAVTVNVKTAAGADPSSDISVVFRQTTITSGNYDTLSLSGALSLTVSSGSTLGVPTPSTTTGNTTNTSTTITNIASTAVAFMFVGQAISGTGIPAGATIASIASTTSITISAAATATNTGITLTLGTLPFRIWWVLFNDASTARVGAINCSPFTPGTSALIYPLQSETLESSTAEGGAGAADSARTIYTGTAVSSKAMVILGYSDWDTGLATAGTWTVPTRTQLWGPGVALPGQPTANTVFMNNTTTFATALTGGAAIADTGTSPAVITPKSAVNFINLVYTFGIGGSGPCNMVMDAFRKVGSGTPVDLVPAGLECMSYVRTVDSSTITPVVFEAFDRPGTTSALTYYLYWQANGTSITACLGQRQNSGVSPFYKMPTNIKATEIMA